MPCLVLTVLSCLFCVPNSRGFEAGANNFVRQVLHIETGKKLGPKQEGELWIKSPLRMKGYMGDAAATAELFDGEGYVRTGDIGYYDQQGCFYIVDRLKELIKYKGFQVRYRNVN